MSAKIGTAALGVIIAIPVLIAVLVQAAFTALLSGGPSHPSPAALTDIPPGYLALYRTAAVVCPGLDWNVLAAIGKIETNYGRLDAPGVHSGENSAGAAGPMQFLQPTFNAVIARHRLSPGGATPPSRYNPHDAIHAAAYHLCDHGADRGEIRAALHAYNHSEQYVHEVLAQAGTYGKVATGGTGDCTTIQATTPTAWVAINYACGQLGLPYVWGGNGPTDGGFDCSGLTTAAYAAAGIALPRTADTQYRAGPRVPDDAPLLPGDLVFYGTQTHVHHVGLYLGDNQMINAPDFGQMVTTEPYRWRGDDYLGATRPWNRN